MNTQLTVSTITKETLRVMCTELKDGWFVPSFDRFPEAIKKIEEILLKSGFSEQESKEIIATALSELLGRKVISISK